VVVGYGTQERRDLTGAIASVSAEQIAEVPTANPMQAIQARAPGVDVVAGGSYRPGVPMNVTVRGVRSIAAGNQPLYVVDGVPLAGGIEDFNPAIIQSIEVLKDASATAVYGSRGSNGVILITTRRGAAGAPDNSIHVTYDAQYGGQSALHLVDMMNGPQTIAERREAFRSAGRPTDDASVFTPDELPQVQCATDAAYQAAHPGCATGTDWQPLRHALQRLHPEDQADARRAAREPAAPGRRLRAPADPEPAVQFGVRRAAAGPRLLVSRELRPRPREPHGRAVPGRERSAEPGADRQRPGAAHRRRRVRLHAGSAAAVESHRRESPLRRDPAVRHPD